jgi:hypothetical protein
VPEGLPKSHEPNQVVRVFLVLPKAVSATVACGLPTPTLQYNPN